MNFPILNSNTLPDAFPLPRIADLLDHFDKSRIYFSLDLANAYQQVRIKAGNEYKQPFLLMKTFFNVLLYYLVSLIALQYFRD